MPRKIKKRNFVTEVMFFIISGIGAGLLIALFYFAELCGKIGLTFIPDFLDSIGDMDVM